jgi:hypothetical protein
MGDISITNKDEPEKKYLLPTLGISLACQYWEIRTGLAWSVSSEGGAVRISGHAGCCMAQRALPALCPSRAFPACCSFL